MANSMTLLVAHGSRDDRWKQPFEALKQRLETTSNPDMFALCYMEMTTPTYLDILASCDVQALDSIQIFPLFMAAGAHVAYEIEEMKVDIQNRYPHLQVVVLPPIGEHSLVQEVFQSVLQQTIQST